MRLILASSSPRRREILSLLKIPFETVPSGIDERSNPQWTTVEETAYLAGSKAAKVASLHPDAVVIGSDTLVDLDGLKIGKPSTCEEAIRILRSLAGREHTVVTAVTVVASGRDETQVEKTRVRMKPICEETLLQYASSREPLDKAGAYSVQGAGAQMIDRLEGDYLSVVGLPLRRLAGMLQRASVTLPVSVESIYRARSFRNWRAFSRDEP